MSGTPHVQRGIHLVDAGRFDQALVEFTKALATDPDRPDVLCNIALCEWELGRKKDAYSHVQQAMGMAPGSTLPMFYHGRFLVEDGKRKKALDVVDQALAIDPEDPDLFSLTAAALSGMNRWRPALEAAEAGRALDAEHEACLSARTMALTVLKDNRAHESARQGL